MSAKSTKTIDDLGIQTYIHYEENRKYFDEEFATQSREVASQITTDVFSPLIVTDYQLLFELNTRGATWSVMPPPQKYNDQKGRLFKHQLAPKLGPFELLELQMGRIDEERKQHKQNFQGNEEEAKEIDKEANALIEMMQKIQALNKIIEQVSSERYRYGKG